MTLMNFADPAEGAKVYGPLFEDRTRDNAPVFGPGKYSSTNRPPPLTAELYQTIKTKGNPVIDVLAEHPRADQDSSRLKAVQNKAQLDAKKLALAASDNQRYNMQSGGAEALGTLSISPKTIRSTRQGDLKSPENLPIEIQLVNPHVETMDTVILKRALDGYLFDSVRNKDLLSQDPNLQDVWNWIKSKFPSINQLHNFNFWGF